MYLKNFHLYLAADTPTGGGAPAGGDSVSEVAQDLADLDAPPTDEGETDEDEETKEVAEDEKELDESEDDEESDDSGDDSESEDEDEEDAESKSKVEAKSEGEKGPVTIKDIKAKYPNLFKEFPELKARFFLTPKFLEAFPDPESAKEAVSKVEEYDNLENTLVGQGDPRLLVNTLANNNPKALRKIVENFGEAVRSASRDDYIAMSTPIIEELIYHAAAHGAKTGNKNLELAAKHLANFVFANGGEIPDISKRAAAREPSENEKQLLAERENYQRKEFQRALGDVGNMATADVDRILGDKLDGLNQFERKTIIKDARAELDMVLSRDQEFQKKLKALWSKAAESGYSDESKSRIKRVWLDHARTLAPGIRNRLRQEALDARNPGKSNSEKVGQKRSFVGQGARVNTGGKSRGFQDPKKIDWKKTSDRDILDS
jgi:hypothetical protein